MMYTKIVDVPDSVKFRIIDECGFKCPFYDDGDDGYGSHCNILSHFRDNIEPFDEGCFCVGDEPFPKLCPLDDALITADPDIDNSL